MSTLGRYTLLKQYFPNKQCVKRNYIQKRDPVKMQDWCPDQSCPVGWRVDLCTKGSQIDSWSRHILRLRCEP